jgi:hypothetical protein
MSTWVNKNQWEIDAGRYRGKIQNGSQGDHVHVTAYKAHGCKNAEKSKLLPNGARQPQFDVPNTAFVAPVLSSVMGSNFPAARNKAYAKFVSRARNGPSSADDTRRGPASLGETIAQGHQALGMIAQRAFQLGRAANALRKGNFRQFIRELKVKPKRKDRSKIKNAAGHAADHWLEYSFGWKPLLNDIFDAMEVLSGETTEGDISGSGRETYRRSNTPVPNGTWEWFDAIAHVKVGGKCKIVNYNLYLLQSLGIANPAQTAWNILPFSFVADWIFDVDTFLGSFTDLLGISVSIPYTTTFAKANVHTAWWYNFAPVTTNTRVGFIYAVNRAPGLPTPFPNISVLTNLGTSLTRAANAVALLGQTLVKMKPTKNRIHTE